MKIRQEPIKRAHIDLIPLMDSMFLILLFFIFAMMSMVVHNGIPLDLPQAITSATNQNEYLTLSVAEDGQLFLEKQPYTIETLKQVLTELKAANKLPQLYIASDRKVEFGIVLQVLDTCRELGITQISFETKDEE